MILRKFLFLKDFEPRDSYKKNSYKKNSYKKNPVYVARTVQDIEVL